MDSERRQKGGKRRKNEGRWRGVRKQSLLCPPISTFGLQILGPPSSITRTVRRQWACLCTCVRVCVGGWLWWNEGRGSLDAISTNAINQSWTATESVQSVLISVGTEKESRYEMLGVYKKICWPLVFLLTWETPTPCRCHQENQEKMLISSLEFLSHKWNFFELVNITFKNKCIISRRIIKMCDSTWLLHFQGEKRHTNGGWSVTQSTEG